MNVRRKDSPHILYGQTREGHRRPHARVTTQSLDYRQPKASDYTTLHTRTPPTPTPPKPQRSQAEVAAQARKAEAAAARSLAGGCEERTCKRGALEAGTKTRLRKCGHLAGWTFPRGDDNRRQGFDEDGIGIDRKHFDPTREGRSERELKLRTLTRRGSTLPAKNIHI